MRKAAICVLAAMAVGLAALSTVTASAAEAVIRVPTDFNADLSDTRSTGHYAMAGTALRVWTESNTSTDKVAEYVDTNVPLADVGEPNLEVTQNSGTIPPGFQLVVDFDGNGSPDGILVGEPAFYGNDWWVNNAADPFVKAGAPITGGGSGSQWHGTLDQWRAAFPDAVVVAFGFSLGSGVQGDWTINAINFGGDRFTFDGRDTCKNGGWQDSADPVFKNQGACVSYFAKLKK